MDEPATIGFSFPRVRTTDANLFVTAGSYRLDQESKREKSALVYRHDRKHSHKSQHDVSLAVTQEDVCDTFLKNANPNTVVTVV